MVMVEKRSRMNKCCEWLNEWVNVNVNVDVDVDGWVIPWILRIVRIPRLQGQQVANGKWHQQRFSFFHYADRNDTHKRENHGKWAKCNVAANAITITITITRRDPKQSIVHQSKTKGKRGAIAMRKRRVLKLPAEHFIQVNERRVFPENGKTAKCRRRGGGEGNVLCVCRGGNVASSQNKQFFFALPAFRPALAISLCQENTLQICIQYKYFLSNQK